MGVTVDGSTEKVVCLGIAQRKLPLPLQLFLQQLILLPCNRGIRNLNFWQVHVLIERHSDTTTLAIGVAQPLLRCDCSMSEGVIPPRVLGVADYLLYYADGPLSLPAC